MTARIEDRRPVPVGLSPELFLPFWLIVTEAALVAACFVGLAAFCLVSLLG